MHTHRVAIIGAGIGGLAAAIELSAAGCEVVVVERAGGPGGKMRQVHIDGVSMDAGPTVFTMRHVFDELLALAGTSLTEHVTLQRAEVLARHAWSDTETLDLYACVERTADAIGEFAGLAESRRFLQFSDEVRRLYSMLEGPYLRSRRPTPISLARDIAADRISNLLHLQPFTQMWSALTRHFHDPRLQQLYGRYATYCGSSPFLAPATLMLVAHVEQQGVWLVEGGMHRLAMALSNVAAGLGAQFRYGAEAVEILVHHGRTSGIRLANSEQIGADAVIVNADAAALADGLFGTRAATAVAPIPAARRSLSAITWNLHAATTGFPLLRHSIFFSADYAAEFDALFRHRRVPEAPTVYVCAQDRADHASNTEPRPERLLVLINAPSNGDAHEFSAAEIEQCEHSTFALLSRCGLHIERRADRQIVNTPNDFERLFPRTGGALYGQASHGWQSSFRRPSARSSVPRLYLAGGSTHPGPGVPMAALSGRQAARCILQDFASTSRSRTTAMPGGIWMP